MKPTRFLSIILAGALQLMPFVRATIPMQAQGLATSAWAIVLKLATGAVTLLSYHAVSGATAIVQPYTVNGTNGVKLTRQLGTSGQTAHAWSTTTAPLGSSSYPLVPGVTLSSSGLISGTPTQAITNSFTITAWEYPNATGPNISQVFTFYIVNGGPIAPTLVTSPQSKMVAQGSNVVFSATASGTQPLTYQWQFGTNKISGATNASLTLPNVQASAAGTYRIIVSNTVGAVSNSATLTVITPPQITLPLQDAFVMSGGTETFSPGVSGSKAVVKWLLNGSTIPSATAIPLVLTNLTPSQSGAYSIILSNFAGMASNSARLLVVPPASSLNAPQIAPFSSGGGPLSISFSSLAGYNYQVQFSPDLSSNWVVITNFPATFTSNQVSVPLQSSSTNGFYRVLMSN